MAKAKTKTVTAGNTQVEIIEENGVVTVKVLSEDAVVEVNGDIVWSIGNDNEHFKRIPTNFHPFLLEQGVSYAEWDEKSKETTVDTCLEKENLTLYIPQNRKKTMIIRYDFVDLAEAKIYIEETNKKDQVEASKQQLTERVQKFIQLVESKGWRFSFSHRMGEWAYAWADIRLKAEEWDVDALKEICGELHSFNQFLNELRDNLDI